MRQPVRLYILFFFLASTLSSCFHRHSAHEGSEGFEEDVAKRQEWEIRMLADPATGRIPEYMRSRELAYAQTLQTPAMNKTGLDEDPWTSIGPWNVGGRTRSIGIDVNNENILIAGGVSGGIWKSTDGGQSWERKTLPNQLPNITCLVQCKKTGLTNIWYAGTGEATGGSVSDNGSFYLGDGVYKSTDNGETWTPIKRTTASSPQSFVKNWQLVWNVALNTYDTNYTLFAATFGSIVKSTKSDTVFQTARGGAGSGGRESYYTDVAVTTKGIVYATLSSEGGSAGIWRSGDYGKTWKKITPAGYPISYGRCVIGVNPLNEDQVYFLVHADSGGFRSEDFRGKVEWHGLWVYHYLSGDGTGTGGWWEDRSQNLPDKGGQFGRFITQTDYDMYIRVKPDDSNMVIIGATNVWRSKDAFKTNKNIDWIGGYGVNTSLPDFKVYPNHHPDNHNLVFYPSDPKKMISCSDGGLHRCDDNTAANITWTPLNHGYLTTQFYTVSMDHAANGKTIIGGLQDNGVYWNPNTEQDNHSAWVMPFNGDGSFVYVPDGAPELYVSKQEGSIYKIKVDQNGATTHWVRIDPDSVPKTKYQFINPFSIDPNNAQRMYLPAGDRIWRNNDLSQYVYKTQLDSFKLNLGWESLINTYDSTQFISAVSTSKVPADIVYYGNTDGKLYKMTNASSGQPTITDITGSNFPKKSANVGPNINCIYVDPENADKLLLVFTNYNIESLFSSVDGGQTWTAISGNLEQLPGGGGNGPSCRWINTMKLADGSRAYLVATTTGLYSTDTLKGSSTHWVQQGPLNIGNFPCSMIDTRESDGKVIVSTHGSGLYATHLNHRYQVLHAKNEVWNGEVSLYPNPAAAEVTVHHTSPINGPCQVEILDVYGRMVSQKENRGSQDIIVNRSDLPAGVYYIRLSTKEWSKTATLVWK